jgi:hypothetical protein
MASIPVLGAFRSRAVVVSGVVDMVIGVGALGIGASVAAGTTKNALPLALLLLLVGAYLVISGLGRVTARLEVCSDRVRWRWSFSWHELELRELEDAALVEKGSPASGASWSGYLAGGFTWVFIWWIGELVYSVFSNEPSLGPVELVLIPRHGTPEEVRPITAWSSRQSHSQAKKALDAVRSAIMITAPAPAQNWHLLHDEWESPEPQQVPPTSV